jgi:hypothetical protein
MVSLMTRNAGVHLHRPLVSRRACERNHFRMAIEAVEPSRIDVPGVREGYMIGEPQERIPFNSRAAGEEHPELLLGPALLTSRTCVTAPALCERR